MNSFPSDSPFCFICLANKSLLNAHRLLGDTLLGTWTVAVRKTRIFIGMKFTLLLKGGCWDSSRCPLPPVVGCIWNEELNQKAKCAADFMLVNKPLFPHFPPFPHFYMHARVGGGGQDKTKYTVRGSVCCDHTKSQDNTVSSLNDWYFTESALILSLLRLVDNSSFSWYQKFYLLHKFMIMAVFISFSFMCSKYSTSQCDSWPQGILIKT